MPKTPKSPSRGARKTPATIDMDSQDVKRLDEPASLTASATNSSGSIGDVAQPDKPNADKEAAAAVESKPHMNEQDVSAAESPTIKPTSAPPKSTTEPEIQAERPAPLSSQTRAERAEAKRAGSGLMGGLAGGLIVLLLGAALQVAGIWPATQTPDDNETILTLQAEIDSLRGQIAALDRSSELSGLSAQIEELRVVANDGSEIEAAENRIAALEQALAAMDDGLDTEGAIAEVDEQLASFSDTVNQHVSRLDNLEQTLSGVTTRLAEIEDSSGTERLIAASALKSAIDHGEPFAVELEAYARLSDEPQEAADLQPYASEGVPTRAEIAAEAGAAAQTMSAASMPADENAGFVDRLSAQARSLVQVRPVGMAEGENVGARIARLEASVRADDYERAIAEYEGLPPEAQEAGAEFMGKVRGRHTADQLIDRALANALQGA